MEIIILPLFLFNNFIQDNKENIEPQKKEVIYIEDRSFERPKNLIKLHNEQNNIYSKPRIPNFKDKPIYSKPKTLNLKDEGIYTKPRIPVSYNE